LKLSSLVLALSWLATALSPTSARAFSEVGRFELSAGAGGGGGRWFTGGPTDGFTCAVCHGEADLPFAADGLPEAGYRPSETYVLGFDLGVSTGDVSMVLEITDATGAPSGTMALLAETEIGDEERCRPEGGMLPAGATEIQIATNGGRPVAITRACGARVGRLSWTAPPEGAGTVWMNAALVRGNASGTSLGDRTGELRASLPVEGAPSPEAVVVGCSATGLGAMPALGAVLVLLLLLSGRARPSRASKWLALALAVSVPFIALAAHAVPGPATTAVVANANVPESVALAERYATERDVVAGQVCALPIDEVIDLDLDSFRTQVLTPLEACLETAGALERIEAIVVIRGVPLRVVIPDGAGTRRVSLAAALSLWQTTAFGEPLLGRPPGVTADCGGTPCYAAAHLNPFRTGVFAPGWERVVSDITWRPVLVTMLHGRSFADAQMLLDSALAAEAMGGADGEFLFMEGRDPARGALDAQYPRVISDLMDRGYTDVREVPFDPDLTGRTLAAFFTGTATIGTTIEGNTFRPGALVDNLTSFGAVPPNFEDPSMEQQVSIARWVAMGVGGVHGTTDEPLNSVFPNRTLITHYVDGATLAEAFHRNMPNVYWHNLVLGDPMLAPYAIRPEVTIEGAVDAQVVTDAQTLTVTATDAEGLGVDALWLYRDGALVAEASADTLSYCLDVAAGESATLLAVAQKRDDLSDRGLNRPKGWVSITVSGAAGRTTCTSEDSGVSDGGSDDAGPDADAAGPPPPPGDEGCGCRMAGRGPSTPGGSGVAWLTVVFVVSYSRRARSR
jgi:uncharacterized protein (TIGR03790 family)